MSTSAGNKLLIFSNEILREDGTSDVVEVEAASSHLLFTLGIHRVVEQQSLDLVIEGSTDGEHWRPLVAFSQKFYQGIAAVMAPSGDRFVRAKWKLARWGRGSLQPEFEVSLSIEYINV